MDESDSANSSLKSEKKYCHANEYSGVEFDLDEDSDEEAENLVEKAVETVSADLLHMPICDYTVFLVLLT